MATLAFIGLGRMGYPMAGYLVKAGHTVRGFNRSPARAEAWAKEHGATASRSVAEAAKGADIVFSCVGDDPDIKAVAEEAFAVMSPGSIFVDHTTGSAELAEQLAIKAVAHKLSFIDAPVSGGEAGAQKGQLTVMCGGDEAAYTKAESVIKAYAKMCKRLGPAGAGQKTKMVNQICIAGLVQALSEGVAFAQCTGQDVEAVFEAISAGAAGSWQMANRHQTMNRDEFEFGFAVEHMRKDLAICLAEAKDARAALPVTALVDQFYAEVVAAGGSRWDTSSLLTRLPRQRP